MFSRLATSLKRVNANVAWEIGQVASSLGTYNCKVVLRVGSATYRIARQFGATPDTVTSDGLRIRDILTDELIKEAGMSSSSEDLATRLEAVSEEDIAFAIHQQASMINTILCLLIVEATHMGKHVYAQALTAQLSHLQSPLNGLREAAQRTAFNAIIVRQTADTDGQEKLLEQE